MEDSVSIATNGIRESHENLRASQRSEIEKKVPGKRGSKEIVHERVLVSSAGLDGKQMRLTTKSGHTILERL